MKIVPTIMSQLTRFYILMLFALAIEMTKSLGVISQVIVIMLLLGYSLVDGLKIDTDSLGFCVSYQSNKKIFIYLGSLINLIMNVTFIFFLYRGYYEIVMYYFFIENILAYTFNITIVELITNRRFSYKEQR